MSSKPTARLFHLALTLAAVLGLQPVAAQQAPTSPTDQVQEVIITGSRIAQTGAQAAQPLSIITSADIERTGLASVGELLSQLTTSGSALNTKFNSSGNFGYPPDGGGIGAGSAQVDLRNLDAKRTLVLVDGLRWVNESSASGVSGSADLNTIPISIIDHIEVLEDGASSIYGSDAIAGVVNIITKKKFDGVEVSGYVGDYSKGGRITQGSLTAGGNSGKFGGVFNASYYKQEAISSSKWWQSSYPEPLAGLAGGSSGTPQGRAAFCDPAVPPPNYGSCTPDQANFYDVTLNNGTTTPVWNPLNPVSPPSTYHNFGTDDRFNYAPYNLLLTPSQRYSLFTTITYDVNDDVQMYAKGLFNNRQSTNQAAPEPIFVGPYTGSGGLADTISISKNNPYNPYGIDLDAASNFGFVTRRPLEGGPRIFNQDVNTWYFSAGFRGTLHFLDGFEWDVNFLDSDNKATQKFTGGYNIAKIGIALGDPTICAAVPGCVPLDLFGGQGRPITQAMLNYILAPQIDSSDQKLKSFSGNITGTIFHIDGRPVGIAVGAEYRKYDGVFEPDPLRTTGESQDSLAFPVSQSYHVSEAYAEFAVPLLQTLSASGAVRYSDYSTFGNTTTYKGGVRWQPFQDFAIRGTYSTGFRAPNLGELYGLTQFGATLQDPCSDAVVGNTPLANACRAQGAPNGFQQANTQITTFTGGNPNLQPEKSDSYTAGIQYRASWAEQKLASDHLTFEATYYNHKVKGAIQAADIQALLSACLAAGGTDPVLCKGFTRVAGGNLAPPENFLENLGEIKTSGEDLKANWQSMPFSFGHLSVGVQATRVNDYTAVDQNGNADQRTVGVEVRNSAIPEWRMNAQIGWALADWEAGWTVRYLSAVTESCAAALAVGVDGCATRADFHELEAVVYNDLQISWNNAFTLKGLKLDAGVNNMFGVNPPICFSCTLNGYDAGTYDLPGAFWNVRATYKF